MIPTIEKVLEQAQQLPISEQQKLVEMLSKELPQKANGRNNGTNEHFQKTATEEEWNEALQVLANEPRIDAPEITDEILRRENLYTREDSLL
ncbi:MAG: hypothetical protein ACR2IA_10815 [Pyrinomonadaceae bacterium]